MYQDFLSDIHPVAILIALFLLGFVTWGYVLLIRHLQRLKRASLENVREEIEGQRRHPTGIFLWALVSVDVIFLIIYTPIYPNMSLFDIGVVSGINLFMLSLLLYRWRAAYLIKQRIRILSADSIFHDNKGVDNIF